MLDPMVATTRWKWLKSQVDKIQDPLLRNAFMADFQNRAIREWGYCPENKKFVAEPVEIEPVLTPAQQEFLDKVRVAIEYGVYNKDEKLERETFARMKMFIDEGHTFYDLPEELQTKGMRELYDRAFDGWLADIDEVIKSIKKE